MLCAPVFGQIAIYDSYNTGAVDNNPTCSPFFTISEPMMVTYIETYHWNNAQGAPGGSISLRGGDGSLYGPWGVEAMPTQDGVPNVFWIARPNEVLPAGSYTIEDSDPATWSQNSESPCGFARVEGQQPAGSAGVEQQPIEQQPVKTGSQNGIVSAYVRLDSKESPIGQLIGDPFEPVPGNMVELIFTYLPPEYRGSIPETIQGTTNSNGCYDFMDIPPGSKFRVRTSVRGLEKELVGEMPDPIENDGRLYLAFDYVCQEQMIDDHHIDPCASIS